MKVKLSLLMITKNAEATIEKTLQSVKGLVDEIVIVDDYSFDRTVELATNHNASIFFHHSSDLGSQKRFGFKKTKGEWVLVLDSDEVLSEPLQEEIRDVINNRNADSAYLIPYQNHFLGKPIKHGGENYKMLRLFKRDAVSISPALVHEHFEVTNGSIGELQHTIHHYSYRSLTQMFSKFTKYAINEAKQKVTAGEKTGFKKIFMYPVHMFYARYIKSKGYKDGLFRIPLDIGFAYMEFVTYVLMLFMRK